MPGIARLIGSVRITLGRFGSVGDGAHGGVAASWAKEARHLGTIVRYADDGVGLCRTAADAQRVQRWLQGTAQSLKLSLHPEMPEGVNPVDTGASSSGLIVICVPPESEQRYRILAGFTSRIVGSIRLRSAVCGMG